MKFFDEFGKAFVPERVRPGLRKYLMAAGIYGEPYTFFGIMFFVSIGITAILYMLFYYPLFVDNNYVFFFFLSFISFAGTALALSGVFFVIIYFYVDLVTYQRTSEIERILPDYLQVVSTNVKSGMSLEKSLWIAIDRRFGILAAEMEVVLKKVMTGMDLDDALMSFAQLYNSPMLVRSISLLVGEIDSGGKIAHIIDSIVIQLKKTQKMKAELAASVITYMIFIGAIVVVISPALFALSYSLLGFMDEFLAKVGDSGADTGSTPLGSLSGGAAIDTASFKIFSQVAIIIVALLSSGIVSIIEKGNIKAGIKYFPIFAIGAFTAYTIFMIILEAVFGGIVL